MPSRFPAAFLAVVLAGAAARAEVVLPAIISDHMVLQKSAKTRVWGKADPGEAVAVTLDAASARTTAGADGKWAVFLNLTESKPGPFELIVQGKNRIAVPDVVVGEVWVASGQSNMAFSLNDDLAAKEEIPASANPFLRQFCVSRAAVPQPQETVKGQWIVADPKTSGRFTAVGYYFAKQLQKELAVPVGLISASVGGTVVEGWTSAEAIASVPELKAAGERAQKAFEEYPSQKEAYVAQFGQWLAKTGRQDREPYAPQRPSDPAAEGWMPVLLANGLPADAGLPPAGSFYITREVEIAAADLNKPYRFEWGPEQGFESVYWNGEFVDGLTYRELKGRDAFRVYTIPREQLHEGKNRVTVRVYAPVALPKLDRINTPLRGPWFFKSEHTLPALDATQLAAVPQAPLARRPPEDLPGYLFNGMIAPVIPYTIRGTIWYQGEFNSSRGYQYRVAFPLLIKDLRTQWRQGDFPFYFCQLPMFNVKIPQPGESPWAELRESQAQTLALPHTGMAVLIDTGEAGEIHPRDKRPAGARLAALALANDYGRKISHQSPLYNSMQIENGKIRARFRHTDGGLSAHPVPETYVVKSSADLTAPLVRNSPKSELEGFAICGEDKKWVWADAKIDGDTVLVWSDQVPKPVAVRYAWATNPACNLYNGAGFPASPFRTDDFTLSTQNIQ